MDPCVFRKVYDREVDMVVVVHVDDIVAHAKRRWRGSPLNLEERLQ